MEPRKMPAYEVKHVFRAKAKFLKTNSEKTYSEVLLAISFWLQVFKNLAIVTPITTIEF